MALLLSLGRREDAMLVELRLALRHSHRSSKLNALRKIVGSGPGGDPADMAAVHDYVAVLETQIPVDNSFASPLYVKSGQRLTEKEVAWVAVRALARQHKWDAIESLLSAKTLLGLGALKIRSPIPWDKLLSTLKRHEAPVQVLEKFASCVPDSEERLELASRYTCHKAAVDVHFLF